MKTSEEFEEELKQIDEELDELLEDDLSLCCGAGTNGDYRICEACGEHC